MHLPIPKMLCSLIAATFLMSSHAHAGLVFNLTDTGNAQANAGFAQAASFWSSIFKDDVNININTGFAALAPNVLGQAGSSYFNTSFSNMKTALAADASSAADAIMVSGLPGGSSYSKWINGTTTDINAHLHNGITTMRMTRANAKAQGLLAANNSAVDATITFSTLFDWDFDPSDGIGANLIDFVGVAIHELGHAMGFTSGVDLLDNPANFGRFRDIDYNPFATTLDFTRCSEASKAAGASMDWTANNLPKNYAINGDCSGADLVVNAWSLGSSRGDGRQASHWKDNVELGIMDPTAAPRGRLNVVTDLDIQALDVIGWDLARQVPEPTGIVLLFTGLLGMRILRRKQATQN